jgi:probable rRNA maturation factor
MNRVAISAEEVPLPSWSARADNFIIKVLDRLGRDRWDLSMLFCNNRYIRSLNARFRNIDEPTDVLSFALGTSYADETTGELRFLPGDIVVSLETLAENAGYFRVSQDEELRRLLIHGILHLDGMDHQTNGGAEPMLKLQEQILAELSGETIL